MGLVMRPLLSCYCSSSSSYYFRTVLNPRACLLRSISSFSANANPPQRKQKQKSQLPYASPPTSLDFQSRGIRLVPVPLLQPDLQEASSPTTDSDSDKSRNQRKRDARRAVQWGMELANFSAPQIKRILRVAALGQEVYNAVMLVKSFGSDVREGKRRQYNYIGRLLREAEKPDLLGDLIQATKDGDQSKLQQLAGAEACIEVEGEYAEETDCEEEEESDFSVIASRWSDGLIDKDSDITNEVYSIHSVEFDRQELRKLVRRVHNIQNQEFSEENKAANATALAGARNSLIQFLRSLAKQMENDSKQI